MALQYKSFSDIKAKELNLTDNFFKLKSNFVQLGNFEYNGYNILKDVSDVKTNNYSNLVLTKKQKNSKVLEVNKPEIIENSLDIITTLSFYSNNAEGINKGAWLCFNKSYDTWDMDVSAANFAVTYGKPNNHSNYLFRLEADEKTGICQISHNFGNTSYFLEYNDGFKYTNKKDSPSTKFYFHLDNNLLRLYFKDETALKRVVCKKVASEKYILDLEKYNSSNDDSTNDNIFISKENSEFKYYTDASWITYDRKNKIDTIDNDHSTFTLSSQFLLHHEYHTDDSINILPLKNSLTYQGSLVNGSNLTKSDSGSYIKKPLVDFKTYTGINSGINQEYGNDNIILSFNFTDQEYHIEPGEKYEFSIPEAENFELSPLYPYDSLNINDTAFSRNGAFGSDIPYFADRFEKLQNENTKYNNGTYLCTWLYKPSDNAKPIWLDRYYYPDAVYRHNILTAEMFVPTFENIINEYYNISGDDIFEKEEAEKIKLALQNNTYIDKKSDITIEAGTSYSYKRIGKNEVNELFDSIFDNRISVVKDQNLNNVNLDAEFAFNRENWRSISAESFKNTSAINFNTNLYINPYKKMGIQIFGADHNSGVNIQNRKDLAPFHYYASEDSVNLLNNTYNICQSCNIFEKYNIHIKRLIIGEPFEDLYILTDDSIIILEYDLKLKSRILYKDIDGLYDIIIADDDNIGDLLSKYNSVSYNSNLYIPINSSLDKYIIKIIFNPDKFKETERSARRLSASEFINNFTNTYDKSLVETEDNINSLYVDNEGNIYAFNYDKLKMTYDGDTIYGIYSNELSKGDKWYYIFNQSIGRLYSSAATSKYAEFSSDISIDNIAINPLGEMALIRGFRPNATTGEIDENEKCLEIYDRTKTKRYNYPLKNVDTIRALDYYCYIDDAFEEQMVFAAIGSQNNKIVVIEYQSLYEKVKVHYTGIDVDYIENFVEGTNSNKLIDRYHENKIYFNMFLPMGIYNEKLTIEWDLKDAQEGWYNINVEADTDNAIFRVKINDELFGEITYKDNPKFQRFSHTNDSIFDSTYFFGSIGKDHGLRLHEILSDGPYDPYTLKNTKTENTTLYNRSLKYHEYQATRLYYSNINPLTITLPCGIRNGIEEITRYFRYRTPGFVTNKVKINISGLTDIKYESEINALKKEIMNALNDNGDCLTKINEIEFI